MKTAYLLCAYARCLPLLASVFGMAACSSNTDSSAATGGDSGTLNAPGDDSGLGTAASDGGIATFWFDTHEVRKVGIGDVAGNEVWSESIDEDPMDVVIGGGSAWILTNKGSVLRYDQTTHAKIATIPAVATTPSHMVFGGNALWVTDDTDGSACNSLNDGPAKVVRVDPATNAVAKRIPVAGVTTAFACNRFDGLASDGTNVYALVNNDFGIARIDPANNNVGLRAPLAAGGGFGTGFVVTGGGNLWVHNTNANTLVKLDPLSLAVLSTTPVSADYLGEHWVASADALYLDKPKESILRIDAKTPTTQTPFPLLDSPDDMALYQGTLYVTYTESLDAQLVAHNPTTLAETARVRSLIYADDIAFIP